MIDCHNQVSPEDDNGSSCSESTTSVFFEMLGLPVMDFGVISSAVDDDVHADSKEEIPLIGSNLTSASRIDREQKEAICVILAKCQAIIRLAEELSVSGFYYVTEASHTDNEGITHIVRLQEPNTHKLSVFEHQHTLDELWNTLKPVILPHINEFTQFTKSGLPLGLNPRLRVLRYDASDNDVFNPHFDATTHVTGSGTCEMTSLLTVLVYLNDGGGKDFDGGETYYLDSTKNTNAEPTIVVPSIGKAAVFEHDLFHSSVPLTFGTKFVLRTDILFQIDEDGGVDKPRNNNNSESRRDTTAKTLLELCEELSVCEHSKNSLNEMGLIDLTLESLLSPGLATVKQMLFDVLNENDADLIVNSLITHDSNN
ncbi:hypothetical protein HJC23_012205 [Cyclotella cryptica]|uniref:Fe2OG dioxygenase domain-containing protein n=1 Tax=Cyclotella cryptica TaxID=29204 RepID=A0ABD3PU74_9STRA